MDSLMKYLIQNQCLSNKIDANVLEIVKTLDSKLTEKQKIQLVCHYMVFFASQFRKAILFENQHIPINSIVFLFNYSGSGKDTTINRIRTIFRDGLEVVEEERKRINLAQATEKLNACNDNKAKIKDFLYNLPPLEIGLSTPEGLVLSLDNNQAIKLGSLNINTNEFIAEMSSNMNLLNMMSSVAEIYDVGFKHSKQLKNKEEQVNTLHGIFLSALFTSSFDANVDINTRLKLTNEFRSRFARRSSITFNIKVEKDEKIENVEEWIRKKRERNTNIFATQDTFKELYENLAKELIKDPNEFIAMTEDAIDLVYIYREYCSKKGKEQENKLTKGFSYINITNRWFQALKLSGGLAICNGKTIIDKETVIKAINITELINDDIFEFETELNKGAYEIIIDYCNSKDEDKVRITAHELVKAGLINNKTLNNDLQNIVKLANSKDKDGIYTIPDNNDGIEYKRFKECKDYGISYLKVNSSNKDDRVKDMNKALSYGRVEFYRIEKMLQNNFLYSPYQFIDGKRNNANLINKTNLIVFDIDNTDISIDECHRNLDEINHIIATTSDKDNPYKYRIIIPFDREVEIESSIYKRVVSAIARDYLFGIKPDILPQSQIYYAYEGSKTYTKFDGENLRIKDYITQIKLNTGLEALTPKQKQELLSNPFHTFEFAYCTPEGGRHKALIKVAARAFHLDSKYDATVALIDDINNSFANKLEGQEYDKIIEFVDKIYGRNV